MPSSVATLVYLFAIGCMFWLDRYRQRHTSKAIWIPVVYLWIIGSRSVAQWLDDFGLVQGSGSRDESLEGNPIDRVVFAFLLLLGAVVLTRRSARIANVLRSSGPLLVFFLYCAVSIIWSAHAGVAFKRWIKALGDVVMVLLVLTERDYVGALKKLLATVGFILIPVSVLLIKYYPDLGRHYQ